MDGDKASPVATIAELVRGISGTRIIGDPTTVVRAVTSVSQQVVPGGLFVAIRGRQSDGHRFVSDAVNRGASAVVVEQPVQTDATQVVTQDSRAALAGLAAGLFDHPSRDLRVIGVTGTDGKTTTSHLISHVLAQSGRPTGQIGTLGAVVADRQLRAAGRLTTPQANDVQELLRTMVDSAVTDAIIEASSMGLAMQRLDQVRFTAAVVTNITAEHLEDHGGYEEYWKAKASLVERTARSGGTAVLNRDDPGSRRLSAITGHAVTYGLRPGADVWADHLEVGRATSRFTLHTPLGSGWVNLPLPGLFNISNALAVAATAVTLGVDLDCITTALETAQPTRGRMLMIDVGQPFTVCVDYAHTIAAVRAVLGHLRSQHPEARLIAVTGSGLRADHWKRPLLARDVVQRTDLAVFCAGDARYETPAEVVADFAEGACAVGAVRGQDFVEIPDRRAAIAHAIEAAGPGDVVAVLGKGHEDVVT